MHKWKWVMKHHRSVRYIKIMHCRNVSQSLYRWRKLRDQFPDNARHSESFSVLQLHQNIIKGFCWLYKKHIQMMNNWYPPNVLILKKCLASVILSNITEITGKLINGLIKLAEHPLYSHRNKCIFGNVITYLLNSSF